MTHEHVYVAKKPDENGLVDFSKEENDVWRMLYTRQIKLLEQRACEEFTHGVHKLKLNPDRIPQLAEVSHELKKATGWQVVPVEALISFKEFFDLLAHRQFPAATFIRRIEDLDYLKEPDIFHEVFGHCPLLTHEPFANFTERIGIMGQQMTKEERVMLARLYWFTVEFGLITTPQGLRIYGGGILSSKGESVYALESPVPVREAFDLLTILRTPYRYDEMQKKYFIINSFEDLFALVNTDLRAAFSEAQRHGLITEEEIDVRSC
jgi:phenylalanine-4-hydroxylase